jgi:hypothetical protein
MKEHEHYQQSSLPLDAQHGDITLPQPGFEHSPSDKLLRSSAVTGAGAPLPADFDREYAFELATRERLGLPTMSPSEFRQIRNWRDGIEEDEG